MEYISPKECAEKWGVSTRSIQMFCSDGKIPGAKQIGKMWMIPFDATKPLDGRTKQAKNQIAFQNFRFPLFIFSESYSSSDILNEEENELKKAQLLYLEGNYESSIILCNKIVNKTDESYIKIGAFVTIGYNAIMLRLAGEFNYIISRLKSLIEQVNYTKEDYKLIFAGLIYHLSWDPKPLFEIDLSKLSYESLAYYQYIMTLSNVVNGAVISSQSLATLTAFNKNLEFNRIEPLNVMMSFLIAFINFKQENISTTISLVKYSCDIALKNNWLNCLSKFYAMLSSFINGYVNTINTNALKEIAKQATKDVLNWRFISKTYNGATILDSVPIELLDFAILISRNKTNKEIAAIKNLSINEIKSKVDELLNITHLKTRSELINHLKQQLEKFKLQ